MNNEEKFFTESKLKIEQYVKDRVLLMKLQTVEKISQLAAKFFSALIIGILGFFILFFLSIMGGYFFAEITGSTYIGFGIVTAFYIVILIVILYFRKSIIEKKVTNEIIETIFDKSSDI